ncbi:hypothetical protein NHQ30_009815 [Ciborinia camelliae]|nr:hypothetical protein NHQ30_009815 [Ciborinia camelliae]
MQTILAHPLIVLSIFTYSSAALVLQQSSEEHLVARDLGSQEQGWNEATVKRPVAVSTLSFVEPKPFQTHHSKPPITDGEANIFTDLFLNPTTIIVPASTIYYTETTVTITPRDVGGLETSTATVGPLSRALPQTFQTVTASPAPASSITHENERRG